MKSPLRLEQHFLTGISLRVNEGNDLSEDFSVKATPKVSRKRDSTLDWIIHLEVEIGSTEANRPATYEGTISFFGHFTLADDMPEESRARVVAANGSSILYGAIREMVANLTARGPHPMLVLPSLSFIPDAGNSPAPTEPARKRHSAGATSRKKPGKARASSKLSI